MNYQSTTNSVRISNYRLATVIYRIGICALTLTLTGCFATPGTTTAPLAAALQKAKASTDQAIADNAKVRELARGMGKGVVEIDGAIRKVRLTRDRVDYKTSRALEILEKYREAP